MTLATHTIIGLGLSSLLPAPVRPISAFAISLASHYLLDTIPHWEYNLPFIKRSEKGSKAEVKLFGWPLFLGSLTIISEFAVGLMVALALFYTPARFSGWAVMASVVGSVAPDFLQFMYYRYRSLFWFYAQRWHGVWHSNNRIKNTFWGISSQLLLIIFVVGLTYFFR